MPQKPLHPWITPRQGRRWRWPSPRRVGGLVLATLLGVLATSRPVPAAEFACAAGDVACLIDAINTANATGEANTITLEAGTYTLTAVDNTTNGPNGLPSVTSPLTIRGAKAHPTILERDASAPSFRLVHVAASGTLTLDRLILQGGQLLQNGNGLFNNGGTVFITHATFRNNGAGGFSGFGGGLFNSGGTVVITHSTFARNDTTQGGAWQMGPPGRWSLPTPRSRTTSRMRVVVSSTSEARCSSPTPPSPAMEPSWAAASSTSAGLSLRPARPAPWCW